MHNLQAITREKYQHKRFKQVANFKFTAQDAMAALVAQELPKALLTMPVAFLEADGGFVLRAVQGFEPGKNLFVAVDGRWVGGYIPSAYRGYPFALVKLNVADDAKKVLCIDEDSGLVIDGSIGDGNYSDIDSFIGNVASAQPPGQTSAQSEAFFTEDGELSPAIAQTLNFLDQVDKNRQITQNICALLQKYALIEPWPVKVQTDTGEKTINGLHRINEVALNQVNAESLKELLSSGALLAAYCQLLSMQQMPRLAQLAQAHAKANQIMEAKKTQPPLPADLNLDFMSKGSGFSFETLFKSL